VIGSLFTPAKVQVEYSVNAPTSVDLLSFLMSAAAVRNTDLVDAATFARTLPKPGVGQSRNVQVSYVK